MNRFFRYKKGQGFNLEIVFLMIIVFTFGISIFLLVPTFQSLNTSLLNNSAFADQELANSTLTLGNERMHLVSDGATAAILVLLAIGMIILGFLVDTHPIMYFIIFAILLVVGFVAAQLSNVWEDIAASDATARANFPLTDFILSNFMVVILGYALLIILVIIGKSAAGGERG